MYGGITIGKFVITFFRTETIWFWGLPEAQIVAGGLVAGTSGWPLWRRSHPTDIPPSRLRS